MNTLKMMILSTALVLSSQAFAQNFDRGTDPRAAGISDAPQATSRNAARFYKAEALAPTRTHDRRIETLQLR